MLMEEQIFVTLPYYLPSISWYTKYLHASQVIVLDIANKKEFKIKQSKFASSSQATILSIPIEGGRATHLTFSAINVIANEPWQMQHFKTIKSIYGKAPYFEYFCTQIEQFYNAKYNNLLELNLASISLINSLLGITNKHSVSNSFQPLTAIEPINTTYQQVFMPQQAFVPNCSMLDATLCEGKMIVDALRNIKIN